MAKFTTKWLFASEFKQGVIAGDTRQIVGLQYTNSIQDGSARLIIIIKSDLLTPMENAYGQQRPLTLIPWVLVALTH